MARGMKIYSWNVLFRNADFGNALRFIRESDADIFCLQEVPEELLAKLRALPYALAAAPETDRIFHGARETQYVVTLSKYPIAREERVALAHVEDAPFVRTRLFVSLMMRLGVWARGVGKRNALITDLATPSGLVRVCNLHLPLASRKARVADFERALERNDGALPTVVCGDFNTLEKPHITLLAWLLGGLFSEALCFRSERRDMEKRFRAHGLLNPLYGRKTHGVSRSQLDHILLPERFSVEKAQVLADARGSDHHPIFVEAFYPQP
jgi:endonuclease/exonuclease/phosphatase family metal-dependent hydrolase